MTQPENDRARKALNLTLAAVTSLVGCITVVIIIAALLLGLWLDARFGTRPTLTVVLTLVALPVTLVVMYVVVRWTTRRMRFDQSTEEKTLPQEDADSGKQT